MQAKLSHSASSDGLLRSEHVPKRLGVFATSDLTSSSFCISMAFMEAQNAKSIHEVYKKIQLNKFPTISKNLGLFLKNKRETKKSNQQKAKISQKEDDKRT